MSYPFPDDIRNPERKGPNPFAEDAEVLPDTDDPFAASREATSYRPEYERVLTDRARMSFGLGVVGIIITVTGWMSYAGWQSVALLPFLALAFSLPALILGRSDLRAMTAGAMHDRRRSLAAAAMLLGVLGLFNTLLYGIVAYLVWELFGN